MEILIGALIVIMGVGALIFGVAGLTILALGWWFLIPIICAMIGGWLGFFFGLGLVAIIGVVVLLVKGSGGISTTTIRSYTSYRTPVSGPAELAPHEWTCPIVEDAHGNSFRVCGRCHERNNTELRVCWKCSTPL